MMSEEKIELDGGEWLAQIAPDGSCFIRDQDGERIHASCDHKSTAVHLAMALSRIRELRREIREIDDRRRPSGG